MAEEEKVAEDADAFVPGEAEELEKLLDVAEAEVASEAGLVGKVLGLVKKVLPKEKKTMIIVGAGALVLLILVAGSVTYFVFTNPKTEESPEQVEEAAIEPEKKKKEDSFVLKTGIYTLDPFFMPLNMGSQKLDRFINIKVNLLLSNRRMERDLEKNLRPLRQNIYKILRKKKTQDYTKNSAKLKSRLKQEIVTLANSLLLSGTGTVEDVFFTQFIVK